VQRRTGARHGQGGRGRRETSIGMPVAKTGWPLVAASIGHALIACTSLTLQRSAGVVTNAFGVVKWFVT